MRKMPCGVLPLVMKYGRLDIYTGSQPTTADDAETGTKLVSITDAGGSFTPGQEANGLRMGDVSSFALSREGSQVWSGVAVATGTAGWFRFYDNAATTGSSTTAIRFDGSIATSGAQLNMSNTSITTSGTTTIDTVAITQPAA